MTEKDRLIGEIAARSKTARHELLVDFMDQYGLACLSDATVQQLNDFLRTTKEETKP